MSRRLPPQFEVEFKGLSGTGEASGRYKNRKIYAFGVFPGEKALVRPLKKRRSGVKVAVVRLLRQSKERRRAREEHFLSCSPWQIVDEKTQHVWKIKIVKDIFKNEAGILPGKDLLIEESPEKWNYRNKMEFSFSSDNDGGAVLALHKRFRHWEHYSLDSCAIVKQKINKTAALILREIRRRNINPKDLKNLLLRYSSKEDKCLAVLYAVNEDLSLFDLKCPDLAGWQIVYSDPRSPSTVASRVLLQRGRDHLSEQMAGLDLKFHVNGFFQVNIASFEKLLDYLRKNISKGRVLTDLYAGVGTIGIALSGLFEKVNFVEFDERAVAAAKENAAKNRLDNAVFMSGAVEKNSLEDHLDPGDTLVVDPPRSGLHPKAIKKILKIKPKNFIYVSCNPITQAKDFAKIKKEYSAIKWRLFDLYPQTPHIESVIIMRKKNFLERILRK